MDIRIQIERVPPNRYRVLFMGREIGVWRDPECSAARFLVAHGLAARRDTLRTFLGNAPSMIGSVDWFANHAVRENDRQPLRFIAWKPFPASLYRQGTPSDDPAGS